MNDFYTKLANTAASISLRARTLTLLCRGIDPEGCLDYEELLNLKAAIDGAILTYREEVPACDRESIRRVVDADMGVTEDDCTCNERSWYGDRHDSVCPLAGRERLI